jgi:hypothetical protein
MQAMVKLVELDEQVKLAQQMEEDVGLGLRCGIFQTTTRIHHYTTSQRHRHLKCVCNFFFHNIIKYRYS